jgi:hypothetical protein
VLNTRRIARRPSPPWRRSNCSEFALYSRSMEFSPELRQGVLAGDINVSIRLWRRPRVSVGKRYRVGPSEIEVDAVELVPFSIVGDSDVERSGERSRESLRTRAAHAGPIEEDTMVYRIEFHVCRSEPPRPDGRTH